MKGSKDGENDSDKLCPTCGLWFSNRGYIPHSRNCNRDEPILDPERYDVDTDPPLRWGEVRNPDPSEGDPAEGIPHADGEGPTLEESEREPSADDPKPDREAATDGGSVGLDLEGPPEPSPPTENPSPTTGIDDQDDQPDSGCPECGTGVEDLPAGKTFVLEDGQHVRTDESDDWCPECEGIVDGEEVLV
jgi:hypothetical protein